MQHDSDSDSDEQQNHGLSTSGSGSNLLKAASRLSNGKNAAGNNAGDEAIQVDRLNLQDARKVFLDSNVNGRNSDFSPALVNTRRNRYPASLLPESSSYSIRQASTRGLSSTTRRQLRRDAEGQLAENGYQEEPETPTEKLRRLRYEMEELETELEQQAQARKETEGDLEEEEETALDGEDELPKRDDADKTRPKGSARKKKRRPKVDAKGELSPAILLSQLKRLRGDMGSMDNEKTASGIDGTAEADREVRDSEGAEKRSALLKRLYGQSAGEEPKQSPTGNDEDASEKADSSSSSRMDERLEQLEKYVGANEAPLDETHPLAPPLLTTLAKLEHQMHLLTQPRHLDTISRRVKLLVNDLERVHEARRKIGDNRPLNIALSSGITVSTGSSSAVAIAGGAAGEPALPPDALQKIDSLFTLLPRIDPLVPLTPHLLTRLRSLSTLHTSSHTFHKDLQDTQASVDGLQRSEEFLKDLLGGLEQSLESNQQVVKSNLESIQGRIDAVLQRLDELS